MNITMTTSWTLELNTSELRLVLKALGRRLKPEELEEAKILGDRLSIMRGKITQTTMKQSDILLNNIQGENQ